MGQGLGLAQIHAQDRKIQFHVPSQSINHADKKNQSFESSLV